MKQWEILHFAKLPVVEVDVRFGFSTVVGKSGPGKYGGVGAGFEFVKIPGPSAHNKYKCFRMLTKDQSTLSSRSVPGRRMRVNSQDQSCFLSLAEVAHAFNPSI